METIYRIEFKNNRGRAAHKGVYDSYFAYRHPFIGEMRSEHNKNLRQHPAPQKDFYEKLGAFLSISEYGTWKFACPSLELLYKWFDGYVEDLLKVGFGIKKIQVKEYVLGKSGKQCVYEARRVYRKSWVEYEK